MPEMELPDLHLPEAGVYVFAVMSFPTAAQEHQNFVDSLRNQALLRSTSKIDADRFPAHAAPEVARAALGTRFVDMVRKAKPLTHADSVHVRIRSDIVAWIFQFVLACAEHDRDKASVEHAFRTLEDAYRNKEKGFSRATLVKHWQEFAPAAHLWLAHSPSGPGCAWFNEASSRGLVEFLGYAEALRQMAEDVKHSNSQEPLFPTDFAWRVPERFVLPEFRLSMPTPAQMIAIGDFPRPSNLSTAV